MQNELDTTTYESLINQLKNEKYSNMSIEQIINTRQKHAIYFTCLLISILCMCIFFNTSINFDSIVWPGLMIFNMFLGVFSLMSILYAFDASGIRYRAIYNIVSSNPDIINSLINKYEINLILFNKLSADILIKTNEHDDLINSGLVYINQFNNVKDKNEFVTNLLASNIQNLKQPTFFAKFQTIINQLKEKL